MADRARRRSGAGASGKKSPASGSSAAASAMQERLKKGGAIGLKGKAGNFKNHAGKGTDASGAGAGAGAGRRGGNRGGHLANGIRIDYGDAEAGLPHFLKGRVKGITMADESKVATVQAGAQGKKAVVKGKISAKRTYRSTDRKGRKYVTGDPNDKSLLGEEAPRPRKKKERLSKNPIARFIQQQLRSIRRRILLHRSNKAPVVLGDRARAITDALDMTQKHLKMLRFKFLEIDFSHLGTITYDEFFEALDLKQTKFTNALYDQMIARVTGQALNLDDFVVVVVLYSMYARKDILRMVFNMFDKDGSGTVDEEEFMALCELVNDGAPIFPGNFRNALEQFDVNDDGLIDFDEFQQLNSRYPLVLFPAFRLQDAIQEFSLGSKEWLKIQEAMAEKRRTEAYMAKHGGMPPPTLKQQLKHGTKLQYKLFRCCCKCLVPK